jgi:hypothetical protein
VTELAGRVEADGHKSHARPANTHIAGRAIRLRRSNKPIPSPTDLRHERAERRVSDPLIREPSAISPEQREANAIVAATSLERSAGRLVKIEVPHHAHISGDEFLEEPATAEVRGRGRAPGLDEIGSGSTRGKIQLEEQVVRALIGAMRIPTHGMLRRHRLASDGP